MKKLPAKSIIYISGPITGRDYREAFYSFHIAEIQLRRRGYQHTINPMKRVPKDPCKQDWITFMEHDIDHLFGCQAIFMLDNWERSKGARIEKRIAENLGLPVFYQKDINMPVIAQYNDGLDSVTESLKENSNLTF